MQLYFENESNTTLDFDLEEIATKVIEASVHYVHCPYEVEVNLLLVNNTEIRELNREYREMDKATDVLSFPLIQYDQPADFSLVEQQEASNFDPESGLLMLGDIVISMEKLVEQAEEYQHSTLREYSFLIAHSMLHLFGFDHIEEDERIEMEQKQEDILRILCITRDIECLDELL